MAVGFGRRRLVGGGRRLFRRGRQLRGRRRLRGLVAYDLFELDSKAQAIVSEAVAAAERETAGEIVTVLADRSDGYSDVVLVWAAGAAFTAMSLFAAWFLPALLELADGFYGGWHAMNGPRPRR